MRMDKIATHPAAALPEAQLENTPKAGRQLRVVLTRWRIVGDRRGTARHLVGFHTGGANALTTAAITDVDPGMGTVWTSTGRAFQLSGPPAEDLLDLLKLSLSAISSGIVQL